MSEKSVKCSTCGTTLTAGTEDELVTALQEHAKEKHDKTLPENKAREAVKRGHT